MDDTDPSSLELCEHHTYFQCPADDAQKLWVPATDGRIRIDDPAPSRSVTEGAGCGQVDEPVFGSPTMDGWYELHATGLIGAAADTLTVELHLLGPGAGQLGEDIFVDTRMTVNGISVFGSTEGVDVAGDPYTSPDRIRIAPEVTPSSTNASVALRWTVTGIQEAIAGSVGAEEYAMVELTVNYPHTGECEPLPPNNAERCVPAGALAFVWGSTEVPSGVAANLADESLWGLEVPAVLPEG